MQTQNRTCTLSVQSTRVAAKYTLKTLLGMLAAAAAGLAWAQQSTADDDERFAAERNYYWQGADYYYGEGNYVDAVKFAKARLDVEKRWFGAGSVNIRDAVSFMGMMYAAAEDWPEAESHYRQYVELCIAAVGEDAHETVEAKLDLEYVGLLQTLTAENRVRLRDADRAGHKCRSLLWTYWSTQDDENAPAIDLEEIADLTERALADKREILGSPHPQTILAMNLRAETLLAQGNLPEAEKLYAESAGYGKVVLGDECLGYAASLDGLGRIHQQRFELDEAEESFTEALAVAERSLGRATYDYQEILGRLAEVVGMKGETARAATMLAEGLVIDRGSVARDNKPFRRTADALVADYRRRKDADFAARLEEITFQHVAATVGEESASLADYLALMGRLYFNNSQFERADPLLQRSLEMTKRVLGDEHARYAARLYDIAEMHKMREQFDDAAPLYGEALDIVRDLLESTAIEQDEGVQLRQQLELEFYLHNYLDSISQRPDAAAEGYLAAMRWKGAALVRQRAIRTAAASSELAPVLADLQAVTHQWASLVTAIPEGDERWDGTIAELAARKKELEIQLTAGSAEFRAAVEDVRVEDLVASLPANAALVDFVALNYIRGSEYTETRSDLAGQYRVTVWMHDVKPALFAFVVRPGRTVRMVSLDLPDMEETIDQWRAGHGATAEARGAGDKLRAALWDPLSDALGDADLVLVSPHGALGKLPFGALPGKAPGTYLIEDVAVALVPVPQLIPQLAAGGAEGTGKALLAVGGVDYDRREPNEAEPVLLADNSLVRAPTRGAMRAGLQRSLTEGLSWGFLSGTDEEATFVENLYRSRLKLSDADDSVVPLHGPAATEEAFCRLAPHYEVLHVSTHGFFLEDRIDVAARVDADGEIDAADAARAPTPGLFSGLVLAGANNPPPLPENPGEMGRATYDGYLTADEIAAMRLDNTRLVVLPACYSALGQAAGGEGMLGIQRAFQAAGVRTTVGALWAVDDKMTQRLMTAFYRNALEGKQTYLEALRAAQLEILNELRTAQLAGAKARRGADAPDGGEQPPLGSPYYWAAFTLSGDWR